MTDDAGPRTAPADAPSHHPENREAVDTDVSQPGRTTTRRGGTGTSRWRTTTPRRRSARRSTRCPTSSCRTTKTVARELRTPYELSQADREYFATNGYIKLKGVLSPG